MNKQFFLYIFILFFGLSQAQEKLSKEEKARRERNIQAGNPFVKYGSKAPVATLSKGKYLEVHDLDSIVTIGTMRWHVDNKQIVGHIVRDTLNPDAQPIGDSPGMWMSPDPLSEEFPDKSPYAFANNNPLRFTDPTGMAPEDMIPPDDHFDFKGNYLYTDNKKSNNIIIHTGLTNYSFGFNQTQLKDFTFTQGNYSTLSNIANHYSKEAGVDLKDVHNSKISVADAVLTGYQGGQTQGHIEKYNDGNHSGIGVYGETALMNTDNKTSTISINLFDGKINPLLNDANAFKSTLDHEGGPIGHLVNPEKQHTSIYKDQIAKPFAKNSTPEFKAHLEYNLNYYKKLNE